MAEEDDEGGYDMFHEDEPPTPEPVFQEFTRLDKTKLQLRLIHHSPLWGHLLWSAGKVLANYLDAQPDIYRDRNVLELGAAAALPSIICALNGAATVVATDYPDSDLIKNIEYNLDHCSADRPLDRRRAHVRGFIWGREVYELVALTNGERFDLLILSDLVFNHQAHPDLLRTCVACLSRRPNAQALVFFTHHRPHLAHKDLHFFELAPEYGFAVEKIVEDKADANVMFENGISWNQVWIVSNRADRATDPGSRDVRATVHGYRLTWQAE